MRPRSGRPGLPSTDRAPGPGAARTGPVWRTFGRSRATSPGAPLDEADRQVLRLILLALLAHLVMAAGLGLGVDESYVVAAGRHLRLGYFDHPPAVWWLSWFASHLAGSEAPLVVRLPFIMLFAVSTWLMHRLTGLLFGPRAGLWASVTLNLSPVFALSTGDWVLPDGPLTCALLGAAYCLARALELGAGPRVVSSSPGLAHDPARTRQWWLGAGFCAGLALFAKYSAALTLLGAVLYLVTQPIHRRWLMRPEPWLASLAALAVFLPVLGWNATHGWVSFAFQGSRAAATKLHPFAPLLVLAGEAVFVLPWLWLPMMLAWLRALAGGPRQKSDWLLACLGAPPIVLFVVISLWSPRVLFHWAAPGYLMLLPLLGRQIAAGLALGRNGARNWMLASLRGTAILAALVVVLAALQGAVNWLPLMAGQEAAQIEDWTALRPALTARGLLTRGTRLAAIRWHECGKIDYALGADWPVACLTSDPRQYGLLGGDPAAIGQDMLILAPRTDTAAIQAALGSHFAAIETLAPLELPLGWGVSLPIPLYLGREMR
jgi:4-amino-4-deoxy-L-arabinose transferase-like glycosyltransferase